MTVNCPAPDWLEPLAAAPAPSHPESSWLPLRAIPGSRRHWLDWRPLLLGLLQRLPPASEETRRRDRCLTGDRGGHRHGAGAAAVERRRTAAWFHLALAEGLAGSLAQLAEELVAAPAAAVAERRSPSAVAPPSATPPPGPSPLENPSPWAAPLSRVSVCGSPSDQPAPEEAPLLPGAPGGLPSPGSPPAGAGVSGLLCGSQSADSPLSGSVAIVLSGGCFQNGLLLKATRLALERRGFRVHGAEAVPGNDGGLALGQLEALRRDIRVEAPLSPGSIGLGAPDPGLRRCPLACAGGLARHSLGLPSPSGASASSGRPRSAAAGAAMEG